MKCGDFYACFFVQQVARYGEIPPRYGMKCGDFLTCFFVQRVARYGEIPPRCVIHDFVQQVARYGSVISYCSVHLDARPNHARNVIPPFSGIHDFVRSVHLDARKNHAQNVIHHLSGIHDFVQQVARYGSVISYCSVHLDARKISPRCGMKYSGFWACFFVQRVARYGRE